MLFRSIEKPTNAPSNLVATGPLVLDTDVFQFEPASPLNGEYFLPEVLERYSKEHPIAVVEQSLWIPVGYPEDITKAERLLGCSE